MTIYNDCKIVINLNQLVKDRPCGKDLHRGNSHNYSYWAKQMVDIEKNRSKMFFNVPQFVNLFNRYVY